MVTTLFGLGLVLSLEPGVAADPVPAPEGSTPAMAESAPATTGPAPTEPAPVAAPTGAAEAPPVAQPAPAATSTAAVGSAAVGSAAVGSAPDGDRATVDGMPTADVEPEPGPTVVSNTPSGPPFYTDADMEALRERYELAPLPTTEPRKARWRCLVADPTCTFNVEVNATSAYAYRVQQGSPVSDAVSQWHSGRSQYDVWVNLPGVVETRGKYRYTKLSLGPKGGVIVSDSKTLWGNAGLAMRYWFGRGRWAPTLELSSALTFKLTTENMDGAIQTRRSPIGVTADIGVGLGGFGALIFGGQYDSPLAREDVSEVARVYPSGMFFVGFRGNIVWGAPAAAAVGTTALSQRVESGVRQ